MLAGPLALIALAVIVGSVFFVTGGSAHGQSDLVSTNPADILAGQQLFESHCQSCHGYQGGGATGPVPGERGRGGGRLLPDDRAHAAQQPRQPGSPHRPFFDPQQIRELVAYVNALPVITKTYVFGPTIPTIAAAVPDDHACSKGCVTLSQGQQGFSLNCGQCHQAAGSGGMLSKGNVIPGLHNANLTQVGEAMRIGPQPMPVFSPAQMSNQEMSAIAHYVQYLHQPANPGGLGISHFGPVAEGFVGVIFGFGLLLLAVRMIGTRG